MRILLTMGVAMLIAGVVHAQTDRVSAYPTKPLRIICNAAPGGVPDVVARLIADKLTVSLGQAVVVENRPGALGTIATAQLAKAAPDGYTIATVSPPHTAAPSMMPNLPYDTLRDLVPIRQHSSATYFVLVRSSAPYKSLADLVITAKARPGALAYASSGIASPPHLVAELFSMQAGIKLFHVPFNGAPAAMTAMLGDQPLDIVFATALTASTPLRNGRLRGLANSGATRMAGFPDVPTIAEQGFADFEVRDWQGFVAPAGTPKAIIDRIAVEIGRAVDHPDVKTRLTSMGMEAVTESSPEAFGALFRAEYARWAKVIKEAGIRVE
jgi:tripartite-type tricarboxylate transporter receptor subunit TctC